MTNERITIQWRNETVRVSLFQMQQVINGISSDYTNTELSAMLDMFVRVTKNQDEQIKTEQAERNAGHQNEVERRSDD